MSEPTWQQMVNTSLTKVEMRVDQLAKRIEILDKKFMDTWMQNLPVKTCAMLDRLDKLEKDRLVDVIGRIENLEKILAGQDVGLVGNDAMPSIDTTSATPSIDVEKAMADIVGEDALNKMITDAYCSPPGLTFTAALIALGEGKAIKRKSGAQIDWIDYRAMDWEIVK